MENQTIHKNYNDPNDPYYLGDPICNHCQEAFDNLTEIDGLELCEECLDTYKFYMNKKL